MPDQDDDNFLLRWSRRKRGATSDAETGDTPSKHTDAPATETAALDTSAPAGPDDTPSDKETAESVPPDLEGVDIDALDYESDYTKFLQDGVPEALKRRALRQLWRSNPILANVDGLNDYDDDFTDAALAVDFLKTVHKVGRGYLTDDDSEDIDDDLDGVDDDGDGDDARSVADAGDGPRDAESARATGEDLKEADVADVPQKPADGEAT